MINNNVSNELNKNESGKIMNTRNPFALGDPETIRKTFISLFKNRLWSSQIKSNKEIKHYP